MNRDTDRRTNPYFVAWSRSHGFVDPASNTFRITLIQIDPLVGRLARRSSE
jgi:hypothetical protein